MRRWSTACALLLLVGLAGCASQDEGPAPVAPAPEPVLEDPDAPVVLADVSSADCAYNDFIWLVPVEQAQAFLPPGFTARTIFTTVTSAFVVNAFSCTSGFGWNGWDLFVLAQPPAMPAVTETFDAANRTARDGTGLELDLYSLALHSDHDGLRAAFAAAGIPLGPGTSAKTGTFTDDPAVAVAGATLMADGQVLGVGAQASVEAGGVLGTLAKAHHRQWHVTADGTWLLERAMTTDGGPAHITQGPAACILQPSTLFTAVVGPGTCTLSQDILGGMEWAGHAYFFPGVQPQ